MSTASISAITSSALQNRSDTTSLEQRLKTLEKELQVVKQGKSSETTKAQKIKELEAQIQQIKAQIQQQKTQAKGGAMNQGQGAVSTTPPRESSQETNTRSGFDSLV